MVFHTYTIGRRKRLGPSDHLHMVRNLALSLPAVEEGASYGTPAYRTKERYWRVCMKMELPSY